MLSRIDLRERMPAELTSAQLQATLPRAEIDVDAAVHQVRPVVEAVRERGVAAALDYTEQFDEVRPETVRVPADEVAKAAQRPDPTVRAAPPGSTAQARPEPA